MGMALGYGESLRAWDTPNWTKSLDDALQKTGFLVGWEGGSLELI